MSDLEKLPPDHGINADPEPAEDRSFAERRKALERAFAEYGNDIIRSGKVTSEFERLLDETLAVGMGDEYFQPWSKGLEVARAALLAHHERVVQERDNAESALLRHGYRKSCDIPACNCGDQWSHGGHAADRLREISDEIGENGFTLLAAARRLNERLAQRDARIAELCALVDKQAEDDGLWFVAVTAPEAYLQQELRRLHAAVDAAREGK